MNVVLTGKLYPLHAEWDVMKEKVQKYSKWKSPSR